MFSDLLLCFLNCCCCVFRIVICSICSLVFNSRRVFILLTNNKLFKMTYFTKPNSKTHRCKWSTLLVAKNKILTQQASFGDLTLCVLWKAIIIYYSSWFSKHLKFYWDPICWLHIILHFHLIACVFCSPLPLLVCRLCAYEASPFRAWNVLDPRRFFICHHHDQILQETLALQTPTKEGSGLARSPVYPKFKAGHS